jgi:hypothetical protein
VTRLLTIGAIALVLAPPGLAARITTDRTSVATALGRDFRFTTTVSNRAAAPTAPLVAHLNVLSLKAGTYVDPEDWSSHRTRYLGSLPAGASRTLDWSMKAVNAGTFAAYVTVLPQQGSTAPPVTSRTVRVTVADRKTIDAGGILPLAVGLPALLALAAVVLRRTRRAR